jgi:hypothetical protein
MLSFSEEEVNITEPPEQKVVGPLGVIVGTVGKAFTVTLVATEVAEQKPLLTVTEYDPELLTVIDCVVAPVDHVFPVADEDVKMMEPPAQNVVGPLAVIVGVTGVGFTVMVSTLEFPEEHPFMITSTVYIPEAETVID